MSPVWALPSKRWKSHWTRPSRPWVPRSPRLASGLALCFLVPQKGSKVRHPGASPAVHGQKPGLRRLRGRARASQAFCRGRLQGRAAPCWDVARSITQTGLGGWGTENKPPLGLSLGALGAMTFPEQQDSQRRVFSLLKN